MFNFDNIPAQPTSAAGEPTMVSTVVDLVNSAPRALSLREIVQVLKDSGIEGVPADTTVRDYLNRAAKDGRITKPSRQSYGAAAAEGEEATDAPEVDEDALTSADVADLTTEADDDPLAGL